MKSIETNVDTKTLTTYLDELLSVSRFQDYTHNGLQVEGAPSIQKIATAVTASRDVIEAAIYHKVHALIVHHGYFWRGESPLVIGMKRERLRLLLSSNINLLAYHLPLDCHPKLGNNACIAHALGLKHITNHMVDKVPGLLWTGHLDKPQTIEGMCAILEKVFARSIQCIGKSTKPIQHIALCSGGAQDFIEHAYTLGVDAYLSGEVSERTYYQAQEYGLPYFVCGHHATERFGIQALGKHISEKYRIDHVFLDSNNPV